MDRLNLLRLAIEGRASTDRDVEFIDHLCVTMVRDVACVDFYGDPSGESYFGLLETLAHPEVANSISSIDLRGPDTGANGTRNWDLSILAESATTFPILRRLCIEQTKPADHNQTIVAKEYGEDGVLARILAKAPALEVLVTPSAPNSEFFSIGLHSLEHLSVDSGYDHQNFIANLAGSSCFPKLRSLSLANSMKPTWRISPPI